MRAVAPVVVAALLLCSCGRDVPTSVAPPSTVSPSSPSSVDPAKDPLYLEAVGVYRKYFAEMAKFEAAGYPSDALPPIMDRYITGTMREAVQDGILQSRNAHLAPAKGDASVLIGPAPNPGIIREGSLTSIRLCADGRGGQVIDTRTHKVVGRGALAYKEIYFKRFDGVLKGFLSESKEVQKCPV